MQEYFFARYLLFDCEERKIDIIRKIYHNKDQLYYQNALSLYADMDIINYERAIVPELMDEYCSVLNKVHDKRIASFLFFYRVYLYFILPANIDPRSTIHELAYSKCPDKNKDREKHSTHRKDLIGKSIYIEFEQIHEHIVPFDILLRNKLRIPFFHKNISSIRQRYDEEECDKTLEYLFDENPTNIMYRIRPSKWSFDLNNKVHIFTLKSILNNFIIDKEIDYDKYLNYTTDIQTFPYDFDSMDPFKEI